MRIEKLKWIENRQQKFNAKVWLIVTLAVRKITEMMINFEKSEYLERTDKKNEKETTNERYDYER